MQTNEPSHHQDGAQHADKPMQETGTKQRQETGTTEPASNRPRQTSPQDSRGHQAQSTNRQEDPRRKQHETATHKQTPPDKEATNHTVRAKATEHTEANA